MQELEGRQKRQIGTPVVEAVVDVDEALIEEYRRLNPLWLPPPPGSAEALRRQALPGDVPPRVLLGVPKLSDCAREIHALPKEDRPMALCLSGGGIRSATFSLGVLQAFARSQRIQAFDYLSTVSGGGYIGSWLTCWLRQEKGDWKEFQHLLADGIKPLATSAAFAGSAGSTPSARSDVLGQESPVSRLRAYSNYLSPVWGLSFDALTLVAIFLRNLLLNLCVWLPLLGAMVLLPRVYVALLALPKTPALAAPLLAGMAAALVAVSIAYTVSDLPPPRTDAQGQRLPPSRVQRSRFSRFGFLPMVLAAMLLGVAAAWQDALQSTADWKFALMGVLVHVVGIGAGLRWRRRRQVTPRPVENRAISAFWVVVIGTVGGGLLWLAFQNPVTQNDRDGSQPLLYAIASVPAMLGCYWLALSLYAGLVRRQSNEDDREWWARATGSWLLASLGWVLLFGLTVHLPLWLLDTFGGALPGGVEIGLGGTLLGVATALAGYWSKNGSSLKRRASTLIKATGLRLLDLMAGLVIVILLLVLSLSASTLLEQCHAARPAWLAGLPYAPCRDDLAAINELHRQDALLASMGSPGAAAGSAGAAKPAVRPAEARAFEQVLTGAEPALVLAAAAGLLGFSMLFSHLIGANTFSLHGMYGNRLVRAYLGSVRARRRPHWFTGFDTDDNPRVSDFDVDGKPTPPVRPFHVLNIALNLVKPSSRRLAWQQRKAASFTVTPLRCGADGLGYCRSDLYGGEKGMSLGRALTISGAAASPNMGYHSSPLVTFVMTLFNVRLGWWLPNPGPAGQGHWGRDEPAVPFRALLDEALGATTDDAKSVYLSDGGHFDNLGLYEMVRRRCYRIVVVDATCDPKFQYGDLHDTVRKVRVDLGIPIDLPALLPGPGRKTPFERLLVGRIRYSARDGNHPRDDGWLYLMKPRLTGDEPLPQLAHYAAGGNDGNAFPHQSTADQFFDETQFECYRQLGMYTAEQCFPKDGQWPRPDLRPKTVAPGTPAPGPVPDKDEPALVPALPAARSGLLDGLGQLGGGAALATALTVGGTLGVAGTVSLAPSEVRLAAEDRTLLREGLTVKLSGNELRLSEDARRLLAAGLKVDTQASIDVAALNTAAERLQQAADRLQAQGGGSVVVSREFQAAVITLQKLLVQGAPPAGASGEQFRALIVQLDTLVKTMKDPGMTVDIKPLTQSLNDIKTALEKLETSIKDVNPRRSVRGQDGGAR